MNINQSLIILACAMVQNNNQCIHVEQLKFIEKLLVPRGENLDKLYRLLGEDSDSVTLDAAKEAGETIRAENSSNLPQFQKKLLRLLCYDGNFDEAENKFIHTVFPDYQPDEKIVKRAIKQFRRKTQNRPARGFFERLLIGRRRPQVRPHRGGKDNSEKLEEYLQGLRARLEQFMAATPGQTGAQRQTFSLLQMFREADYTPREITLALVGRTKAGKSTLFYLLSGFGKNMIGEGKQRTTRFPVATHINGVRVIDTPGLDAAAQDGKKDTEKTLRILHTADFICYVASDGAGKPSEYFEKIIKMNKPLCLLVNYKSGIQYHSWGSSETMSNLEKWQEPWKDIARAGCFEHVVSFHPLYELGAQYGCFGGVDLTSFKRQAAAANAFGMVLGNYHPCQAGDMFLPAPELYEQAKRKALLLESGYYEAVDGIFRRVSGNYRLYRAGSAFRAVLEHYERMKEALSGQMQRIQAEIWAAEAEGKRVRADLEEEYGLICGEINQCWDEFATEMEMSDLSVKKRSFEKEVQSRAASTIKHIERRIEELSARTPKDFLRSQEGDEAFRSGEKKRSSGAYRVAQGLQYGAGAAAIALAVAAPPVALALALASPALGIFRSKFLDSPAERREKREAERKQSIRDHAEEQKEGMYARAEAMYDEFFALQAQDTEKKVSTIRHELDRVGQVYRELDKRIAQERDIYGALFLALRQPGAVFVRSSWAGEASPVLRIIADGCQEEDWTETYVRIAIRGKE